VQNKIHLWSPVIYAISTANMWQPWAYSMANQQLRNAKRGSSLTMAISRYCHRPIRVGDMDRRRWRFWKELLFVMISKKYYQRMWRLLLGEAQRGAFWLYRTFATVYLIVGTGAALKTGAHLDVPSFVRTCTFHERRNWIWNWITTTPANYTGCCLNAICCSTI
jgi:hypothetical protein